jgi:23S rRNA pseudouridine1911/1915/1917 synthase
MAVVEKGRYALTHYMTHQCYFAPGSIAPLVSRIECLLDTGRTHQIRVHMLHAKCPLVGDPVYGISTTSRLNRLKSADVRVPELVATALQMLNRQALHAAELHLTHPKTGKFMEFAAPLPDDLLALENALAILTFAA